MTVAPGVAPIQDAPHEPDVEHADAGEVAASSAEEPCQSQGSGMDQAQTLELPADAWPPQPHIPKSSLMRWRRPAQANGSGMDESQTPEVPTDAWPPQPHIPKSSLMRWRKPVQRTSSEAWFVVVFEAAAGTLLRAKTLVMGEDCRGP